MGRTRYDTKQIKQSGLDILNSQPPRIALQNHNPSINIWTKFEFWKMKYLSRSVRKGYDTKQMKRLLIGWGRWAIPIHPELVNLKRMNLDEGCFHLSSWAFWMQHLSKQHASRTRCDTKQIKQLVKVGYPQYSSIQNWLPKSQTPAIWILKKWRICQEVPEHAKTKNR